MPLTIEGLHRWGSWDPWEGPWSLQEGVCKGASPIWPLPLSHPRPALTKKCLMLPPPLSALSPLTLSSTLLRRLVRHDPNFVILMFSYYDRVRRFPFPSARRRVGRSWLASRSSFFTDSRCAWPSSFFFWGGVVVFFAVMSFEILISIARSDPPPSPRAQQPTASTPRTSEALTKRSTTSCTRLWTSLLVRGSFAVQK